MYNPVDMRVSDPERLQEREIRERQKKQRFELRHGIEENVRVKSIEEYEKAEMQKVNRMNPKKYMEFTDRGFDIFTNKNFDDPESPKTIHKPLAPERPRVWDIIEYQKTLTKPQPATNHDNGERVLEIKSRRMWKEDEVQRQTSNRGEGKMKPVLSQAAIEQVTPKASFSSSRSVRTGGFQKVHVNH